MPSRHKNKEGFITQALEGDYPPFKENRITQLTAASFNHSAVFRRCFLEFLGARNARNTTNCTARTQQSIQRKGELGHLDLEIIRGRRTVVLVENKVDAPLKAQQLKFYAKVPRLKTARKVALVRNYFDFSDNAGEWHVLHWSDFYICLCECLDRTQSIPETDAFIVRNFKEYLESAHMHNPTEISKNALNDLARMLRGIRFAEDTNFRSIHPKTPVFQTAADWVQMMEAIFEDGRLERKLTKAARKRYRFGHWISHWSDEDRSGNTIHPWIGITAEIWFPKPRGKTKSVGLGLFVYKDGKWNIDTYRHVTGSESIESGVKPIVDGRGGKVVLATLSKKVLKTWRRWIP